MKLLLLLFSLLTISFVDATNTLRIKKSLPLTPEEEADLSQCISESCVVERNRRINMIRGTCAEFYDVYQDEITCLVRACEDYAESSFCGASSLEDKATNLGNSIVPRCTYSPFTCALPQSSPGDKAVTGVASAVIGVIFLVSILRCVRNRSKPAQDNAVVTTETAVKVEAS